MTYLLVCPSHCDMNLALRRTKILISRWIIMFELLTYASVKLSNNLTSVEVYLHTIHSVSQALKAIFFFLCKY